MRDDHNDLVGRWPRCPHCDELLMGDSKRCKNPVCPSKDKEGDRE